MRACLRTMIEEEREHLSWIREWLDTQSGLSGEELREMMCRFEEVDDYVYPALREEYAWPAAA